MPYSLFIAGSTLLKTNKTFEEIGLGLQTAFRQLGHDVPIVYDADQISGRPIVLGTLLIPRLQNFELPPDAILYNLEQIAADSLWITEDYLQLLRSYEVWDYSQCNIDELKKRGITNVKLCRIGYMPELTRIPPADQNMDVVFIGAMNPRRRHVLDQLKEKGVDVTWLTGAYGRHRDDIISRAKIVLNIHYYEARVFEIVRVSYLLANKVFVVSELGNDKELEKPFTDGLVFAPYDKLAQACLDYLKEPDERVRIAEKGFERMRALDQVGFLKEVLGES